MDWAKNATEMTNGKEFNYECHKHGCTFKYGSNKYQSVKDVIGIHTSEHAAVQLVELEAELWAS